MADSYTYLRTDRGASKEVRQFRDVEQAFNRKAQPQLGSVLEVPFGLDKASIEMILEGRSEQQLPFGSFAPTLPQAVLVALACNTPLGRGRCRWLIGSLIEKLRPGPLDVERLGLKMRLHYYGSETSDKRALLHVGSYDREEIACLSREIRNEGQFVDIGAHTGFYSMAVKANRPDVNVIAFEPKPVYCSRFRFNIQASGIQNASLVAAAVGPKAGRCPFFLKQESLVGSGRAIEVAVVPLYETLRQRGFTQVDALKIDIEGYEDRVLFPFFQDAPRGMWPKVIVIEHCAQRAWKRDCLQLARSLGYRQTYTGKANTILLRDRARTNRGDG